MQSSAEAFRESQPTFVRLDNECLDADGEQMRAKQQTLRSGTDHQTAITLTDARAPDCGPRDRVGFDARERNRRNAVVHRPTKRSGNADSLGRDAVFGDAKRAPRHARRRCARLAWSAAEAA
ncbi:MAG TPA: hypothetical protein VFU90_09680, partial [Candidatus Tumulicola sp.]|nr:hypothetical protein [Candidatus Tumulicola sp.]